MKTPVLYISYDGLLEPLGQSQVLAYLERLSIDRDIYLITFEKPSDLIDRIALDAVSKRTAAAGIKWRHLTYHKKPSALATAYDISIGTLLGFWLIWKYKIGIVHARSYVPAVMALSIKRFTRVNFVFDMRGFWADERVEGGIWPAGGTLYRFAKWFERRFILNADHLVSLTRAAMREISTFPYMQGRTPPFTIIPTCADLGRFTFRQRLPSNSGFVLGYVGTASSWYLFEHVATCFRILLEKDPSARLLILNRGEHDYIRTSLLAAGIPTEAAEIRSANPTQVPVELVRMSAAVFFIKPVFSKQASAPTRLAELLASGIPCLSNEGVGDMAEVLRGDNVGVTVHSFEKKSLSDGVDQLLRLAAAPDIQARCRESAIRHFSLEYGVAKYGAIYDSLDRTLSHGG